MWRVGNQLKSKFDINNELMKIKITLMKIKITLL